MIWVNGRNAERHNAGIAMPRCPVQPASTSETEAGRGKGPEGALAGLLRMNLGIGIADFAVVRSEDICGLAQPCNVKRDPRLNSA